MQGLLRLPPAGRPNWFLPDNRPDLNYWFWVDLPAMSAADKLDRVAPFYIDAEATPNPGGWPKGGVTRLTLPNNHLQYAITWFSLAVALIVIYVLFHRRNARL
jgi:surfeit locus 1 family protein